MSDLIINNKTVSGRHAVLTARDETLFVQDIGSKNGTYINGMRIQTGFNVELRDGNMIRFSNEEYMVEKITCAHGEHKYSGH